MSENAPTSPLLARNERGEGQGEGFQSIVQPSAEHSGDFATFSPRPHTLSCDAARSKSPTTRLHDFFATDDSKRATPRYLATLKTSFALHHAVLFRHAMVKAIEFDGQLCCRTIKVQKVNSHRMLPAEFESG